MSGAVSTQPPVRLRPFVAAQAVSSLGAGIAALVFTYTAYDITGSITASILVALAFAVPSVLLLRVTGAVAQNIDARLVTVIEICVSVCYYLLLAWLLTWDQPTLMLLLLASAGEGVLTAFAIPVWNRLITQSATEGTLARLNSLLGTASAVGSMVGILVGGWVYETFGPAWCMALNAASFVPLAAAVWLLPRGRAPERSERRPASLRSALPAFRDVPLLRAVVACEVLLVMLCWPLLQLLPEMANEIAVSAMAYSAVMAAFYAGSVLVAPWLKRVRHRQSHRTTLVRGVIAMALLLAVLGLSGGLGPGWLHLAIVMVCVFLFGLMLSVCSVVLTTALQTGAPDDTAGAIFALHTSSVNIVQIVAALAISLLVVVLPVWWVLAMMGAALASLLFVVTRQDVLHAVTEIDAPTDEHGERDRRAMRGLVMAYFMGRHSHGSQH